MLAFSRRTIHDILTSQARSQICLRRRCIHPSNFRLQVASSRREETGVPNKNSTRTSSQTKTDPSTNIPGREKDQPLPPLSRPLGVRHRPSTLEITRAQRLKDLMDHETRMAQRRHLIKEAGKGYFHDMNMTRRHGGKTWIAPKVLIREDKALFLPNIVGKSLDDGTKKDTTTMCFGRITVLAMLGTQISEVHAKAFVDATHARFSKNPLYQYIQINLQENLLKSLLVKLYSGSLRASVPVDLHPTYLVSSQNMEYLRDPLSMTNSKVGYVYLIDENLKIRWGGGADPTLEEVQALESCTGVLLNRLEEKLAKEAPTLPTDLPTPNSNNPRRHS